MLDEISNSGNNSPSHHSHRHKKGLISSLFHHHHSHHSHHSHSHSHSSTSKSITSTSSSLSTHSVSPSLSEAEQIITKWDPNSSSYTKVTSLFQHSRKEAKEFVEAVKTLRGTMNGLAADRDSTAELVLAQQLMQTAMKRLERELHQILSESRDRLDPESISSSSSSAASSLGTPGGEEEEEEYDEVASANESIAEVERVSALATADVKSIAECMIACGYGKECIKIYKTLRKSIVDEGMFRLRVERFRASQVHKLGHDALAAAVKVWVNAARVAVQTLFKGEKNLCDRVFASASDTVRESCFREIAEEAAENLFRFPEMAAGGKGGPKKTPERIFPLMELYETFSDIWPEMESVFGPGVLSHALSSSLKLRDSIHSVLPEIESAIHHTPSKSLPPGGATHPMTRWVMDYVTKLADHAGVLSGILTDYPPPPRDSRLEELSSSSDPVSVHLAWLVLVLLCKLDSKAELYKDASLSYLFLANNLQFVVETVKSTSLRYILGEEWVSRHEKKVHQYAASYESMAWTKVYFTLPEHAGDVSPGETKEVLGRFTAAFEDEYKKQTGWIVQDGKLRDELKLSIAKKLVPRYREFYYESNFAPAAQWLSPDDIGNYLSDLFHGAASFNAFSPSLSSLSLSSASSPVSSPRKGLSR